MKPTVSTFAQRALLICLACALSACSSAQSTAHAQEAAAVSSQTQRSISVAATGEVDATPDEATIEVGFSARNESIDAAHRELMRTLSAFVAAMEAADFERDDIRQRRVNYRPEYRYTQERGQEFVGFVTESTVAVSLEDLDRVPEVVTLAVRNGASDLRNISYTHSDREGLMRQARARAVELAQARAEELASGFGAQLGPVLVITEGGASAPPVGPQPMMMRAEMAVDSGGPNLDPEAATIRATVHVTFALR